MSKAIHVEATHLAGRQRAEQDKAKRQREGEHGKQSRGFHRFLRRSDSAKWNNSPRVTSTQET